ncbi:MAG: GFA family protein [Myxococcota bacterium]
MRIRRAECACGQLGVVVEGEPVRVSACHCLACQKRTGSAFGVQARFSVDQVRAFEGRSTVFTRTGDSGGRVTFHFCPACGTTVHYEVDGLPGFVVVAVGAFADPAFPGPTVSIYEERAHPWVGLLGSPGVEHLD